MSEVIVWAIMGSISFILTVILAILLLMSGMKNQMNGQKGFWEWLFCLLHIKLFCTIVKNPLKNTHQYLKLFFHSSDRNKRLLETIEFVIALCLVGAAFPLAINVNAFFILLLPLGLLVSLHVTYLEEMRCLK